MNQDQNTPITPETKAPSAQAQPREVHHPDGEKINNQKPSSKGLVRDMSETNNKQAKSVAINILVSVVVVILGVFSGWGLSEVLGNPGEVQTAEEQAVVNEDEVAVGSIYGNKDKDAYADSAEGVLLKGGIDGEGSHRLLRPGGKTQTVYLTSSVIDLDPLVDHKVTVWGDTFAAQKANWLMDVGRVEVLELDAEKPFVEDVEQ